MKLPHIINKLVEAQDNFDSAAYAQCFTKSASVVDEGLLYEGQDAIREWIDKANQSYKTVMKPLSFSEQENILKAEVSGDFPGSPIILRYHFVFSEGKIQSLKVTT